MIRLLLDTHIFLWFVFGDLQLSRHARTLIEDMDNEKLVSVTRIWEIAIKVSTGKISLGLPVDTFFLDQMQRNGFLLLPIEPRHAARVATLPFHHRDPFDRLLAAQSLTENIPLLSADSVFDGYGVTRYN